MSAIEYRSHCKNCGVKLEKSIINNGRVYCSRKCRVEVMETCHNDGNPTNNYLSNLRWDTRLSNQSDRIKHGTIMNGEKVPASKLTMPQVQEIRRRLANGEGLSALGRFYNVNKTTILAIRENKTWTHVL